MAKELNLMLHCGADLVELSDVNSVVTPDGTRSWQPIPHGELLAHIRGHLVDSGMQVVQEAHGLTREGMRYFGMLQVQKAAPPTTFDQDGQIIEMPPEDDGGFGLVMGLRNSHDKSFPAALSMGSGVFVCDNLSFCGEVKVARKHTRWIHRDIGRLTADAVNRLVNRRHELEARYDAYKATDIDDSQAHDLLIRGLDCKALTTTAIPHALAQWRRPEHAEFTERKNVWRLFNSVTEAYKSGSVATTMRRSPALHGLMDSACGLVG